MLLGRVGQTHQVEEVVVPRAGVLHPQRQCTHNKELVTTPKSPLPEQNYAGQLGWDKQRGATFLSTALTPAWVMAVSNASEDGEGSQGLKYSHG